jgi:hypothetical protein
MMFRSTLEESFDRLRFNQQALFLFHKGCH